MQALFRLLSHCPLWLLHSLGAALGWLTWLLSPTWRRRYSANAAQAGYRFAEVRAGVAHAGRMAAELPRLWFGKPLPCEWLDDGCTERAHQRGCGILFLTPHMGCFEIAAQKYALEHGPRLGAITVLYRPPRKPALARILRNARERPYLQTAPATLQGVRQMVRALRRGEVVGLLPDQVPPEGQGIQAPFFGKDAYTMTLAGRLAQQTGAAVLVAWGERLPRAAGFRVHVREFGQPLSDDPLTAATQINQAMEQTIRLCPQQYIWSYNRYKQPRRTRDAAPQEPAA